MDSADRRNNMKSNATAFQKELFEFQPCLPRRIAMLKVWCTHRAAARLRPMAPCPAPRRHWDHRLKCPAGGVSALGQRVVTGAHPPIRCRHVDIRLGRGTVLAAQDIDKPRRRPVPWADPEHETTEMRHDFDPEGRRLPIKVDTATNGEYAPRPLNRLQRAARSHAEERVAEVARRLALGRRPFLTFVCYHSGFEPDVPEGPYRPQFDDAGVGASRRRTRIRRHSVRFIPAIALNLLPIGINPRECARSGLPVLRASSAESAGARPAPRDLAGRPPRPCRSS